MIPQLQPPILETFTGRVKASPCFFSSPGEEAKRERGGGGRRLSADRQTDEWRRDVTMEGVRADDASQRYLLLTALPSSFWPAPLPTELVVAPTHR